MSDYVDYNDLGSQTLDATGGASPTKVYGSVSVNDDERLVLWLDGDANTTDVNVDIDASEKVGSTFGDWKTISNADATTHAKNKKLVATFDVRGVSEVEIELQNNAASSTTITVLANTHESV